MKKRGIIFGAVIIVGVLFLIVYNQFIKNTLSENYQITLKEIELGNEWIKENGWSDSCTSSWRYFHRGCYYDKIYPGGITGGNLQNRNLVHEEIWDLCGKFIFPGHVAYCYNLNTINEQERQECLNFAGEDEYLQRLCVIKENQLIPSESWGPYPGEEVYEVDSWETIESKGYPYEN